MSVECFVFRVCVCVVDGIHDAMLAITNTHIYTSNTPHPNTHMHVHTQTNAHTQLSEVIPYVDVMFGNEDEAKVCAVCIHSHTHIPSHSLSHIHTLIYILTHIYHHILSLT
jgi:sugar/nucleoside kinase (ribokinase family)